MRVKCPQTWGNLSFTAWRYALFRSKAVPLQSHHGSIARDCLHGTMRARRSGEFRHLHTLKPTPMLDRSPGCSTITASLSLENWFYWSLRCSTGNDGYVNDVVIVVYLPERENSYLGPALCRASVAKEHETTAGHIVTISSVPLPWCTSRSTIATSRTGATRERARLLQCH